MRYAHATWNPAPASCFTATTTKKIAVCNHRMVGWANYMRKFQHLKEGRKISAHFTIALDGSVQQHVDTDHVAYTQGISTSQYGYARNNWPLFQNRNPNIDCIGIEHEDGGKPFSDDRPMPPAQLEASIRLHKCLFDNVIDAPMIRGETLISHDMLTANRSNDPGEWLMSHIEHGLNDLAAPALPQQALVLAALEARVEALEHWRNS